MKTFVSKVGENTHKIIKLIIFTKWGLRVSMSMVGYEKAKVHGGGNGWER
jgi:hypothetical protein